MVVQVQLHACRLLALLAGAERARDDLLHSGAARVAIESPLRLHSGEASVQRHGCELLRLLCESPQHRGAVAVARGAHACVAAMVVHAAAVPVQVQALGTLAALAADPDGCDAVVAAGGVDATLRAMRTCVQSFAVALASMSVLRCVRAEARHCRGVPAGDATVAVLRSLWQHLDVETVVSAALRLLLLLSTSAVGLDDVDSDAAACEDALRSGSGVAAVLRGMQRHPDNVRVQRHGLQLLFHVVAVSGVDLTGSDAVAYAGVVVRALACCVDDEDVAQCGCGVLWAMVAVDDSSKAAIGAAAGVSAVLSAMRRHDVAEGVQQWGCRALYNLAENDANRVRMACVDGVDALTAALRQFRADDTVQRYGCGALVKLSVHLEVVPAIASSPPPQRSPPSRGTATV
jgi:hypothetical protein